MNLKPETGIDGGDFVSSMSEDVYALFCKKHKEHRHSEETKSKMSISSNHLPNDKSVFKSLDWQKENGRLLVETGKHNFIGGNIQNRLISEGRHHSQISHICPHCSKSGNGNAMKRYHFDNCKLKGV